MSKPQEGMVNTQSEGQSSQLAWSEIHELRQQFRTVFPRIQKLPVVASLTAWLARQVWRRYQQTHTRIRVLDVGASDRNLLVKINQCAAMIEYKSQDVDRRQKHDYYSLAEIAETFDLVVAAEVIEHLPASAVPAFVKELYRLTSPGGRVVLTTPNVCHPTIFWRDFSHQTPIHYYDLAGLLSYGGYTDIAIYRLTKLTLYKRLTAWWYAALLDLLHCDFAQSIMAVATKPQA